MGVLQEARAQQQPRELLGRLSGLDIGCTSTGKPVAFCAVPADWQPVEMFAQTLTQLSVAAPRLPAYPSYSYGTFGKPEQIRLAPHAHSLSARSASRSMSSEGL